MTYSEPDEWVELPEGWPDKPLHQYTSAESSRLFGPVLVQWVTQGRIRPDEEQPLITERL